MSCQQICKISRKKTLNRSDNIPKSFRSLLFLKHHVGNFGDDFTVRMTQSTAS